MVQSSGRDIFNVSMSQITAALRHNFPSGTQLSLLAVSPDGRFSIHASDLLKPFVDKWYNEDVQREAVAAVACRKRPHTTLSIPPNQLGIPASVPASATSMISPPPEHDEDMAVDGMSPSVIVERLSPASLIPDGRPRKKQRRGPSESLSQVADAAAPTTLQLSSVASTKAIVAEQQVAPSPQNRESEEQNREDPRLDTESAANGENPEETPADEDESEEDETVELRIGDTDAVTKYLVSRFVQIQQLDCRAVAKCWIKVIEPKKQSHSPYNKGEATRPFWWPTNAPHKEPDHLLKAARIDVLIAIIRSSNAPLDQLRAATDENPSVRPKPKELLNELYDVVALERQYLQGRLDPQHIRYVKPFTKLTKRRKSSVAKAPKPKKPAATRTPKPRKSAAPPKQSGLQYTALDAPNSENSPIHDLKREETEDGSLAAHISAIAASKTDHANNAPSTPQSLLSIKPQSTDFTAPMDLTGHGRTELSNSPSIFNWTPSPRPTVSTTNFTVPTVPQTHSPGHSSTIQTTSQPESTFALAVVNNTPIYAPIDILQPQLSSTNSVEVDMLGNNDASMPFTNQSLAVSNSCGTDFYFRFASDQQGFNTSYNNPYQYADTTMQDSNMGEAGNFGRTNNY
ncbi:hypothetical protein DRE_03017 [Drechslerella stenobrocha 248]|uniref:Subtelomeric hrmA-associated cluster protein AFUB-079030/YDR124W-like helical bundle domain-containing protein n=1 Tax=Drechslerella stenobrocha 248 TaxID=1043628 RepID=W7I5S1_9PEZI|nr:hypothetical protein DRE_03017 [Drechslerella stenobrocha 248]